MKISSGLVYSFLVIAVTLHSCGYNYPLRKKHTHPLTPAFSEEFENHSYQIKGRNPYTEKTSVLHEFEIFPAADSSVRIKFDSSQNLLLTYHNGIDFSTISFNGRFKKNGSYQIWLRRKRIEIPPLFPIFYSQIDIKRLRLVLDLEDNLVIHDKWARTANVFIFAAGGSGKYNSYFRKKSNRKSNRKYIN
jgi:hypothetical protein